MVAGNGAGSANNHYTSGTKLFQRDGQYFYNDRQLWEEEGGLHSDVSAHVPGCATLSQVRMCVF